MRQPQAKRVERTRYVVGYDDDYRFEEADGGPMPATEERYDAIGHYQKDGRDVPYAEYLQYYGNPDRHVVLFVRRENRCPHCGAWQPGDAVYGLDFMDDDHDAPLSGTYRLDELKGYMREVAEGLSAAETIVYLQCGGSFTRGGAERMKPGTAVRETGHTTEGFKQVEGTRQEIIDGLRELKARDAHAERAAKEHTDRPTAKGRTFDELIGLRERS